MSDRVKKQFCETLRKAQTEQMKRFTKYYGEGKLMEAGQTLESLDILTGMSKELCKRRTRK